MKIFEVTEYSEDEIAKLLKRNCKKWLHDVGNNMAFRGVKSNEEFLKVSQPHDRVPKTMDFEIHQLLVRAFTELGFKANRDNSFFVFGNRRSGYGSNSFGFFPIGDYDFTWSPKIEDLYVDLPYESDLKKHMDGDQNLIIQFYDQEDSGQYSVEYITKIINKVIPDVDIVLAKQISRDGQFYFKLKNTTDPINVGIIKNMQTLLNLAAKRMGINVVSDVSLSKDGSSSSVDFMKKIITDLDYTDTDIVAALNSVNKTSKKPNEIAIACKAAFLVREDKIPYDQLGFMFTDPKWFKQEENA